MGIHNIDTGTQNIDTGTQNIYTGTHNIDSGTHNTDTGTGNTKIKAQFYVSRELQALRDQSEAGPSSQSQSQSEGERGPEREGQTVIRMTAQGPRKLTLFP